MKARKLVTVLFYYMLEVSKCKSLHSPRHMLVSLPRNFPSFHLPFKELNPPHLSASSSDITSSAVLIDPPNLNTTELHHELCTGHMPLEYFIQYWPSYRKTHHIGRSLGLETRVVTIMKYFLPYDCLFTGTSYSLLG